MRPLARPMMMLGLLLGILCAIANTAAAQGPFRTLVQGFQANRQVVRENNADAIQARRDNVAILQQTGPQQQLVARQCLPAAIVAPHRQQLVAPLIVPQPIYVPPAAPLIQQHFYQPQPLQAPQPQQLPVLPAPQAIIVPQYQVPQQLVQVQALAVQPQLQHYGAPLGLTSQQIVVPSCRF